MTIAREEIFGPVLVVIPYDGRRRRRAHRQRQPVRPGRRSCCRARLERSSAVARRLRAGTIGLNGAAAYGAEVPFGGYKSSGVGRQNGTAGFSQYLEVKSVAWPAG